MSEHSSYILLNTFHTSLSRQSFALKPSCCWDNWSDWNSHGEHAGHGYSRRV